MHLLKLTEIRKTLITSSSTISEAIKSLNKSELKIALVMKKNRLVGTVVDGDIRRGLLKGISLNDKIYKILNKKPTTVGESAKKKEATYLMKEYKVQHIPVLNKKKFLVGLFINPDLIALAKKNIKFVIMAGGFGKRLLPLTKKKPKALIKVFNKPMIEHIIIRAKKLGFFNFILSINYLGDQIKNYFKNKNNLEANISYIEEKNPLGTVGSLYLLKNIKDKYVLVTNCDVISDIDYADVIEYHKLNAADVTMVVKRYETKNPFGVIETKGNNFVAYYEKPVKYENINAGIYVFNIKNFKLLKKEQHKNMNEFFNELVKRGKKVIVYPVYESWADLGTKKNFNFKKQK